MFKFRYVDGFGGVLLWLRKFIKQREFSILNVAGPRQSSCPEIDNYVYKVIHTVIHISGQECEA